MRDKIYYFKTEWLQPESAVSTLVDCTGLSPIINGSKIGISTADKVLSKQGLSPLAMGYEQPINHLDLRSTIQGLLEVTEDNTDFLRKLTPEIKPPKELHRTQALESFGHLISLLNRVYLEPHPEAAAECGEEALRILLSFVPQLEFATPITVDLKLQESIFSFTKIALLIEKLGLDAVKGKSKTDDAMAGLKQASLQIPDYVDALTRLYPIIFTFPFKRTGCSWHFYSRDLFGLPYDLTTSFSDQFTSLSTIRASVPNPNGLRGFKLPTKNGVWRVLREAVNAVNNIFSFINNFTNFVDSSDSIDLMRQNKFEISIHFLFADLQAIVNTSSPHSRFAFTLNFFDRLANLYRGYTGDRTKDESAISLLLMSEQFGKKLATMLSKNYSSSDSEFGEALSRSTITTYRNIKDKLLDDLGTESAEERRGEYIRILRNLAHGGYLETKKYDDYLLTSRMELPEDLVTLPWLLMFGMCSNPVQFFSLLESE
ncbi:hypothetical protein [Sneathiella sp. HT1-7]|uniref:hypothetical protein n=1 Tax=Sneathiella sp. HT1-7 TaxID=2887192 RepID=UPI001D133131|nr:hypothetical protein [Sneathiella sp. HT1-7]MCC3303711.1 hypothetical protein [Sneathiella sp. HT1-7]